LKIAFCNGTAEGRFLEKETPGNANAFPGEHF
jgi:hypothetical protein